MLRLSGVRWSFGVTFGGCALAACTLVVDTKGLSDGFPDAGTPVDASGDALLIPQDTGVDGDVVDPVCPNGQGLLAGAVWPMLGGCPTHGAQSRFQGPESAAERWHFDLPAGSAGYPGPMVGPDDTVYWGTEASGQFLLKLTSAGSVAWSGDLTGNVSPVGALASDGSIIVSASSAIVRLRPDGSRTWKYETNFGEADVGVTIGPDGAIYSGAQDGRIFALGADGAHRWTFDVEGGGAVTEPALAADGTIYTTGRNGKLYAITNGAQKWAITLTTADAGPSTYDVNQSVTAIGRDGTIYVGTLDAKLFAIRPDSAVAWVRTLSGPMLGMAAIAADGTVYAVTTNGKLHAFASTGAIRWVYDLEGPAEFGMPVVDSVGTIFVPTNNALHAVKPDGSQKWKHPLVEAGRSQPAIGRNGRIYVTTNPAGGWDGTLRAIGL